MLEGTAGSPRQALELAQPGARRVFTVAAVLAIVSLAGLLGCMLRQANGVAGLATAQKVLAGLALGLGLALTAGLVVAARGRTAILDAPAVGRSRRARRLAGAGAVLLPIGMAACLLTLGELQTGCTRMLVYLCAVIPEAALLTVAIPSLRHEVAVGLAIVVPAVVWRVASFLPALSTSPLSLGWSEASRYYYASLFNSPAVYGLRTAWPVLHPSRYLLQSIPFLMGELPISAHRAWQVVLWIGVTALVGAALARRWAGSRSWRVALLAGWGFLFLFQGPVYYHLAVGVLPLLLGFRWDRPGRNLALVLVGSVWAGMSRLNWYPVPGLLASALLALESPAGAGARWSLRAWRWPVIWVTLGSLVALLTGVAYARFSGNSLDQFGSTLTSDLLWYRLLPSPTYPLGILPGIALATLPAALLILASLRQPVARDPYRLTLLFGILAILLLGGLTVSVKIGGGGDLHNLDAYLLLLLVICGGLWAGWTLDAPGARSALRLALLALVLVVPAGFAILSGQMLERVDVAAQRAALADLRQRLEAVDGPVLFLTQRQMLTFGEINLPLVEPYEKVHLMEMAMSRNPAYLAQFRRDLEAHRFAVVVSDSLNTNRQGSQHAFGEENDAWLEAVVTPLLESYQVEAQLRGANVWLLVPRDR
jgi:hypothetical protein